MYEDIEPVYNVRRDEGERDQLEESVNAGCARIVRGTRSGPGVDYPSAVHESAAGG